MRLIAFFALCGLGYAQCNIFQNVMSTYTTYTAATPYTPLLFTNDCPYFVTVSQVDGNDPITYPTELAVAPLSSNEMHLLCVTVTTGTTIELVASTGETLTVDIVCEDPPLTADLLVYVEVPTSTATTGSYAVTIPIDIIDNVTAEYYPYQVLRTINGGYTCTACTPSTSHKKDWVNGVWSDFCNVYNALDLPFLPTKKKCQGDLSCAFHDIRSDSNYTIVDFLQFGALPVEFPIIFPNALYNRDVLIGPQPVVGIGVLDEGDLVDAIPGIPNSGLESFISALWINYTDVEEVGFRVRNDVITFQWTNLQIWSGASISVQIVLNHDGDFSVRAGMCSGDALGLLDSAATGWQATDPSKQVLYDTEDLGEPCSLAFGCTMTYRTEFVDQEVSEWIVPGAINETLVEFDLYPITYGVLVDPSQGEIQLLYNGEVVQGTRVMATEESS